MQARLRRLNADYQRVSHLFGEHPYICLVSVGGDPPDRYTFEFHVSSVVLNADEQVVVKSSHQAQVFLPIDYPRRPPFCRMITPVFHPNIDPQKICIGDHWSAGQSLAQLIVRIAEMLCYQSYNVRSPLNASAAVWAQHNLSRLPLQQIDLTAGL
ncbi:MAG TPA: ubiquitin-conjugating enzyme E2 [Blastocatellia bacterium]|nr:ubiquitin-conjugating enzyme E2 [Blastocatellia bacterium]